MFLLGGTELRKVKEKMALMVWLSFQSAFLSVTAPENAAFETVLRHNKLIAEAIQQRGERKCLSPEEEHLAETIKEVQGNKQQI